VGKVELLLLILFDLSLDMMLALTKYYVPSLTADLGLYNLGIFWQKNWWWRSLRLWSIKP